MPDGARQFSNFVKVRKDWAALGQTIKNKGADVAPEEWKNVALFLRKVYQASLLFFVGGGALASMGTGRLRCQSSVRVGVGVGVGVG